MRIAPVTPVLMSLSLLAAPAHAQMPQPKDALDGVDPVALLIQGKEVSGKPEFKVTRGKFDYLFATAENKATFEKNPEKGGMPAMATVPMNIVAKVTGMYFFSPPIWRISCSPAIA